MILHPAVLALLLIALLVTGMGGFAGYHGLRIINRWNPASGSEGQLELERITYLISTIMNYVLGFELMSLFLFIYIAEDLHILFTGAMCAAGTLAVNSYGYPVLLFKIINFLLAGGWLIVNHADNRGYDYPLIKVKYRLLTVTVPLLVLESALLLKYFSGIKPDIITSCCGSLFSHDSGSFGGDLAALPPLLMLMAFFSSMTFTMANGLFFYRTGRAGYLFSAASCVTLMIALTSVLSFISLYVYELPSHHCPFCLLQKEYHYIGYLMYGTIFGGAVTGIGIGMLMPFRKTGSLTRIVPALQHLLTVITLVCYLLFTVTVILEIGGSSLKLM